MGRLKIDQGQLFYEFRLGDAVPEDHLGAEDRHCSRSFLASPRTCTALFVDGSSIDRSGTDDPDAGRGVCLCDPRSERLICREVQVNLAYRWFCKLGIEDAIPGTRHFRDP
jgi:hypothetical protein